MADEEKKDISDAEEVQEDKDQDTSDLKTDGEEGEGAEGEEGADGKKKKKPLPLKLILLIGVPTLVFIIIASVLFLTSFGRELIGLTTAETEEIIEEKIVELPENITYYDMPELLVNIQSKTRKRKPYLRLAVKFELHDPTVIKILDLLKPRIIDAFQIYLRELRVDDLQGSAGSQRLKEELLKRVNNVVAPAKVMDVLFQVFVIQ